MTVAKGLWGKEVRTVPQAEAPSASSSEEGRSCIHRPWTAAAAKKTKLERLYQILVYTNIYSRIYIVYIEVHVTGVKED
jgi:hypothetical protein